MVSEVLQAGGRLTLTPQAGGRLTLALQAEGAIKQQK